MGPAEIPTGPYNAGVDFLTRNLTTRGDKVAFVDADGSHTYHAVAARAERLGAAFLGIGLAPGDRLALVLQDGVDFICAFLGAIRVGLTPIPLNTLLPAADYAYVLIDSGAKAALVSEPQAVTVSEGIAESGWTGALFVARGGADSLSELLKHAQTPGAPHPSRAEDVAFWLYSSGSTGRPKGAQHLHRSLPATAELFSRRVLGVREGDVLFSAGKLFFAYGLGNSLTFPMYAGATAVLFPGRVTPEAVADILGRHGVTIFCGVPTLYSAILSGAALPAAMEALRLCTSAGEAMPADVADAWTRATGTEVIDGIGSTEMLHVFVSNRPGNVRYGSTGTPVPGYEVQVVDDDGRPVRPGELGELHVRGPSLTIGYWNQPEKNAATFVDGWMRSGDKFEVSDDGVLIHRGRVDDMIKVSGLWVSPAEVEAALAAHPHVSEAAVVGIPDGVGLLKTKAFVVVRPGGEAGPALAEDLKRFVKARLLPHKYPRLIEFVDVLPRTSTGKLRRHVLRDAAVDTPARAEPRRP